MYKTNYWLNRTNYFGDGLIVGLLSGIVVGIAFESVAVSMMLCTFLGGALGALIKRKKHR